ncbi:allophanate hydrolase [Photobacterium sanctipauli]|uniref:Allophanate hydrolase n=1 Tax=Photobacterium sanctipauli TaxID=1342794 RepID=A0A2T3NNQ1_9GAMM|nr:biotin-dependent carboxyltransferase family protein [Photobacterium sanctipauli]PSW17613.1 allophanate hydrolase [Photobacterium sanctipauli]
MAGLEVVHGGMLSLVQDLGRLGVGEHGLSQGGSVDLHAHCWANYLLGNDPLSPVIEVTLGKAQFRATESCLVVITGAEMSATVDGTPVSNWQSFMLNKGQVLSFGFARKGLRAYLAVAGGFEVADTLGSCATVQRNQMGGLSKGSPLDKGDLLPISPSEASGNSNRTAGQSLAYHYIPEYADTITLRVIESYQHALFSKDEKAAFYRNVYTVSQETDRMGCRLEGQAVSTLAGGIVSEGIALGAIQIPPNGQPIILLNDRQTLGGYPKLGCVARVDLFKLAQAKPGTSVQFVNADFDEVAQEWLAYTRFFGLPL